MPKNKQAKNKIRNCVLKVVSCDNYSHQFNFSIKTKIQFLTLRCDPKMLLERTLTYDAFLQIRSKHLKTFLMVNCSLPK